MSQGSNKYEVGWCTLPYLLLSSSPNIPVHRQRQPLLCFLSSSSRQTQWAPGPCPVRHSSPLHRTLFFWLLTQPSLLLIHGVVSTMYTVLSSFTLSLRAFNWLHTLVMLCQFLLYNSFSSLDTALLWVSSAYIVVIPSSGSSSSFCLRLSFSPWYIPVLSFLHFKVPGPILPELLIKLLFSWEILLILVFHFLANHVTDSLVYHLWCISIGLELVLHLEGHS